MPSQAQPAALITCDLCPQLLTRQSDADRHKYDQHDRSLDAMCPICVVKRISGARNDRQRAHMRGCHPEHPVARPWIPVWVPIWMMPYAPHSSSNTASSSQAGSNLYRYSPQAIAGAALSNAAGPSNGHWSNGNHSDVAQSPASNTVSTNGALPMSNFQSPTFGNLTNGHAAIGNGAGRDVPDTDIADELNWAFESFGQTHVDIDGSNYYPQ